MKYLVLTLMILASSFARAGKHNLGEEIKKASVSQQRLHRQLLRILQGFEVSIADNNDPIETPPSVEALPEFNIRLVDSQN